MTDLRVHCSQGLGSGVLLKMDLLVLNRWVTRGDEGLRIWILSEFQNMVVMEIKF